MSPSSPSSDEWDFVDVVRRACGLVAGAAGALVDRINRGPLHKYHELLTALGVHRHPPAAASVDLRFTRVGAGDERIIVAAGTRVTTDQRDVVFVTARSTTIEPGQSAVTVRAHHGEPVDGELLGVATGEPGQVLRVARGPLTSTGDTDDVQLGVARPDAQAPSREYDGVTYELWRPVPTFAEAGTTGTERAYRLDRAAGTVSFAPVLDRRDTADARPRALAALPPAGAQIRVWYRTGGGPAGNVAAGALTTMRDPLPGVAVTNPAPARGGRAGEDLAGALARWSHEFSGTRRAVNAPDFQVLAVAGSAGVARAGASAGENGGVRVSLVPQVGAQDRPGWRLPVATLLAHESADALRAAREQLDGLRPLGTDVVTAWARYKPVSVRGRVVVPATADPVVVRAHLHERLYQVISPLAAAGRNDGWPFGEPLVAADVHRIAQECDARVDELRFVVADAPDAGVRTLGVDPSRPGTWYAGAREVLFRSTDDGAGWEAVGRFPGEEVRRVAPAPASAASLVVVTRTDDGRSRVHRSDDVGERWEQLGELEATVTDVAWRDRLLLTTDVGLYELVPGSGPVQVMVDPTDADLGFVAVSSFVSADGVPGVAVAAQAGRGVYLSVDGGPFTGVGLLSTDLRTMAVQVDGAARVLWVGVGIADPRKPGTGCHRARLFAGEVRWETVNNGWTGGTCWDLAFDGSTVLAGSQNGGVLRGDAGSADPQWSTMSVNSGLPLRDRTRFEPVEAVAFAPGGRALVGTPRGVYLETGAATGRWTSVANRENPEKVTIPPGWLLCSDEHDVAVVPEGA